MRKFPAGFMRGNTSKGLMFPEKELPARGEWDDLSVRCVGRRGLAHSPPPAASWTA